MKKIAIAFMLSLSLAMNTPVGAEQFRGKNLFPDISRADKVAWRCDNGETAVIMYRAMNKWYFVVTLSKNGYILVMHYKSDNLVHWFLALPQDKMLREVTPKEWDAGMSAASPNHYQHLQQKPNDCVKL